MAIAKYRKDGFPKEWFLTDFTMEQVEGRLENLEAENARLREALLECVEGFDSTTGFTDKEGDPLSRAMRKAREVLGDE